MTEGAQGAGRGPVCLKNDAGGLIPELAFSPPTTWAGVKVEHCSEIALNAAVRHVSPAPQMPFQPPIKLQAFSVLFFLDLREFRTTDGEHGTNLAGRGSLVRLMLARVITANYAEYLWTRGLK